MADARREEMLRRTTDFFAQTSASHGWAPDIEWFASDRDGHVAMLSTAGLGPIPRRVLDDPAGHIAVWHAVEMLGRSGGLGEFDPWDLDVAPRFGLFAFDYSPSGPSGYGQYKSRQPYRAIAQPELERVVADLTTEAQSFLNDVTFGDACFRQEQELIVEAVFRSFHAATEWSR